MPKVLISDKLSPKAEEIFKNSGVEVDVKTGLSEDELCNIIGDYDGLAIRSATKVTPKILEKAKNLKVVGRAGIGVDNVDIPTATGKGVVVMNTPFGNSITTAEHAVSLMMSLARKIPQANSSTHDGKWEKSKFMGVELCSKTLGLIGCGNIGSIVANRAQGLKMKVVVYDPYLSEERAKDLNLEKVELDELFKRADFISLHTPLNDSTRGIINEDAFKKMKKDVRIVNCARGGLVVEKDLKKALEDGLVAGAAFDVFEEEPAKDNVLFGLDNVICTPHLGASTSEAQENVAIQIAEQISDYLLNGSVTNALNTPSVSAEDAAKISPYTDLGKQLGSFCGQLNERAVQEIRITYRGNVTDLNVKPITSVIVQGVLSQNVDSVNMVNALLVAKERDIKIQETKEREAVNYQTLVRVTLITDAGEISVAGTLFNGQAPRIVEVDFVKLEANLTENMLYIHNEDKPGLIGELGNVLGDAKINIAHFHLGRGQDQDGAIALIAVDQIPDQETLEKVSKLSSVIEVKLLQF